MTWGKPEAARLYFKDEIEGAYAALNTASGNMTCKIVREGPEPKRNWRNHITAWCLISKERVNGFQQVFALQWVRGSGPPRVKVGCQYKTLPQAWRAIRDRRGYPRYARAQGVCIIRLLLLKAQYANLPGVKGMKFDASLKRK